MALSKTLIPLEDVVRDWAYARRFEEGDAGQYFPLNTAYMFIPPNRSGSDVRCPRLPISRYARDHYGVVICLEEDLTTGATTNISADTDDEPVDEVFEAGTEVNEEMSARNLTDDLAALEGRMNAFLEAQERRNKELLAVMERRLSIRLANARAAIAEEVDEAATEVIKEIQKDKAVEVYEVQSRLDTAGPLSVIGSDFLRRTSGYGSMGSQDGNNNGQVEDNEKELMMMNRRVSSTKAKMTR